MRSKRTSSRPAVLCATVAEPDLNPGGTAPISNVLPFVQTAAPSPWREPDRCSEQLLAELLALNLEMIEQLRVERLGVVGRTDFITGMIEHHEKAAALLRAQLEGPATEPV